LRLTIVKDKVDLSLTDHTRVHTFVLLQHFIAIIVTTSHFDIKPHFSPVGIHSRKTRPYRETWTAFVKPAAPKLGKIN